MTNEEIDKFLTEAFDENSDYSLPVINLNPKQKPAQTLALQTTLDGETPTTLVVKLASASELGEKVVNLKQSDKSMQVILFSLSDKGNFAELKNGLGGDPFAAINTMIEIVKEKVKEQRLETVMFRFPTKKMKGKGPQVQRVLGLLAKRRLPQFAVLDEINALSAKHSYVVLYKKSAGLEAKGLPTPNEEKFEKVEAKVGELFVNKDAGIVVSKAEAVAQTIVDKSDKTVNDKALAAKLKVSRRVALTAQTRYTKLGSDSWSKPKREVLDGLILNPPLDSSETAYESPGAFSLERRFAKGAEANLNNISFVSREVLDVPGYVLEKLKGARDEGARDNGTIPSYYLPTGLGVLAEISNVYIKNGTSLEAAVAEAQAVHRKALDIAAKYNITNSFETFKALGELVVSIAAPMSESDRKEIMLHYSRALANSVDGTINSVIKDFDPNVEAEYEPSISAYTGSSYKMINQYLTGVANSAATPSTIKLIKSLDEAFLKEGIKLPKGISLYRYHTVSRNELNRTLEDKIFLFRNYVSTSIKPIIFTSSTFGGAVSGALNPNAQNSDTLDQAALVTMGASVAGNEASIEEPNHTMYTYGFIIKGADKIRTLIPGRISAYPDEAEVILPRGTILKINRVVATSTSEEWTSSSENRYLVEATVIPVDQLDEEVALYDGDLMLSEGTIEEVKPASKFSFKALYEAKDERIKTGGLELLASCIGDLNSVSEKFST